MEASTDSTVNMEMVGEDGNSTGPMKLDRFLSNDFERGSTNEFELVADDVGLPILLRLSKIDVYGCLGDVIGSAN